MSACSDLVNELRRWSSALASQDCIHSAADVDQCADKLEAAIASDAARWRDISQSAKEGWGDPEDTPAEVEDIYRRCADDLEGKQ